MSLNDFETVLKRSLANFLTGVPVALRESIEYSLLGAGKRIRPRLVEATSELLNLPESAQHAAAVAIEMIHCYSLIHDDLPCLDNDDMRRGRLSNHKKFGEATALLAGDALTSLATESLLSAQGAPLRAEWILAAIQRLSWASGPRGMVGGQAAEAELNASSSLADLRRMHAGKTGALFVASILMPADLSGISEAAPEGQCLLELAQRMGSAFQVADDLEDVHEMADPAKAMLSVLTHLSAAEASRLEIAQLQASKVQLSRLFDASRCASLLKICDEVIQKLEEAAVSANIQAKAQGSARP